jgi:two-component system, sensor histidine kinase and response regulator
MEPLDWSALRENCAHDESLVNEVLELFRKEVDGLVSDVRTAVDARQPTAVKRSSHRLKGALVSLAARPSVDAARALEMAGANNDLSNVDELYARFEAEVARLKAAITLPTANA